MTVQIDLPLSGDDTDDTQADDTEQTSQSELEPEPEPAPVKRGPGRPRKVVPPPPSESDAGPDPEPDPDPDSDPEPGADVAPAGPTRTVRPQRMADPAPPPAAVPAVDPTRRGPNETKGQFDARRRKEKAAQAAGPAAARTAAPAPTEQAAVMLDLLQLKGSVLAKILCKILGWADLTEVECAYLDEEFGRLQVPQLVKQILILAMIFWPRLSADPRFQKWWAARVRTGRLAELARITELRRAGHRVADPEWMIEFADAERARQTAAVAAAGTQARQPVPEPAAPPPPPRPTAPAATTDKRGRPLDENGKPLPI